MMLTLEISERLNMSWVQWSVVSKVISSQVNELPVNFEINICKDVLVREDLVPNEYR